MNVTPLQSNVRDLQCGAYKISKAARIGDLASTLDKLDGLGPLRRSSGDQLVKGFGSVCRVVIGGSVGAAAIRIIFLR